MAEMKLKSTKLNEDVVVEVTTQQDGQTLIDSWGLNQLAHSDKLRELGFEVVDVKYSYINANAATCIIQCRDKKGLLPPAVGEANQKNLLNEMSKNLPHTMAYKRALDRAVIEYLGINDGGRKRLYSDAEIENAVSAEDGVIPTETGEIPVIDEIPYEPDEEVVAEIAEEKPSFEVTVATKEQLLAYESKDGKYKGKSVKELLEKELPLGNSNYANWLLNNAPRKEKLLELRDVLLKLQEMGVFEEIGGKN